MGLWFLVIGAFGLFGIALRTEPPRDSRRLRCVSHAPPTDSFSVA